MDLESALDAWIALLGGDRVRADDAERDRYARSTHPSGTRPAAVLFPTSTAEVAEIVRIAGRFQTPLYPISRGNNWGYGDACAVSDQQVIVDLRRMNRILEVNSELAYAVVEPGVTQQQLYEYLERKQLPLLLDVTGAGPDASIVGNTIERGFGHSPGGDHFHTSAGYEIVLAGGSVLNTGFGHYDNARCAAIFKPGIGPSLDGIFTQSNLGIVTRMAVWLQRKPEYIAAFGFALRREEDLPLAIEGLRELRLSGAVQAAVHVANDLRGFSARARYPWERMNGQTPMSQEVRAEMRKHYGIGPWSGIGGLYGTRASVAAARKIIRKTLGKIAKLYFFDERTLKLGAAACNVLNRFGLGRQLSEQIQCAQPVFDLLKGIPTPQHLPGAGWRSRQPAIPGNSNPLDNKWGLYWISPVLPATGTAARHVMSLLEPAFAKYGFEPLMTLTSITPRVLCCVATISYDKCDAEQTRQAAVCYKELYEICTREGYLPYRCGIHSMRHLNQGSQVFWDVARQLKAALDPQQILAPGRYLPPQPGGVPERHESVQRAPIASR